MLGRLFAVAEAYPELKADANFRELQGELASWRASFSPPDATTMQPRATSTPASTPSPTCCSLRRWGSRKSPTMRMPIPASRPRPRSDSGGHSAHALLSQRLSRSCFLLPQAAAAEERISSYDSQIAIQQDGALDVTRRSMSAPRIGNPPRHLSRFPDPLQATKGRPGPGRLRARRHLARRRARAEQGRELSQWRPQPHRQRPDYPAGHYRYTIRYRPPASWAGSRIMTSSTGTSLDRLGIPNRQGRGERSLSPRPPGSASAPPIPAPKVRPSRGTRHDGEAGRDHLPNHTPALFPGRANRRGRLPQGRRHRTLRFRPVSAGSCPTMPRPCPPQAGLGRRPRLLLLCLAQGGPRSRSPGTVVPLFAPPDDLRPAAMRYVVEQKLDNRAFAAALVDLAVKGHVRLVEEEGGWFSGDKRRI